MSNTSIAETSDSGYVFSRSADMSLVAQNFAFTRLVPRDQLGDVKPDTLIELADEVDHHGKPLRFYVDHFAHSDTVLLDRLNPLPCSIEWCMGHGHHEADRWEELRHSSGDTDIMDALPGVYDHTDASMCLTEKEGVQKLSVFLHIEGDVDREQVRELALQLQRAADALLERGATLASAVNA